MLFTPSISPFMPTHLLIVGGNIRNISTKQLIWIPVFPFLALAQLTFTHLTSVMLTLKQYVKFAQS